MPKLFFGMGRFFNSRICLRGMRRYVAPSVFGIALGLVGFLIMSTSINAGASLIAQIRIQSAVQQLNQARLTAQRHQAMHELERAGERAVPALTMALHSDNPVLRRNAADMLSYIVSPQTLEALQAGQ